jgi:hypothetical protein
MAVYWRQTLAGLGQHVAPEIVPLNGLKLMRRGPVEAVFRSQDFVVGLSRRIVATGGLRGSETWRTPNSDPTAMAGTHPTPTARRRIGSGSIDLTPGCFLRCWAVVVPSGETQLSGTTPGGPQGRLEVDCVWTDRTGATVSTTHAVALPASAEQYGAEPAVMWEALYGRTISEITPPGLGPTDELRRWCQHVHVDVTIYAVAGARVVDAVVFEQPLEVAMEADDDGELWCSHLYASVAPGGAAAPLLYPWQRFDETTPDGNPRGGTLHALDVHHGQYQRLGPVLCSWSAARESTGAETVALVATAALEGGGSTTFALAEPGLACGSGGYARRQSSNSEYVLRNRVAAIPVIVRAFAAASVAGSVRVQTRGDSYIDVTIPVGAIAWHVAQGWLEVGITPDHTRCLIQLFGTSCTVHAVTVHYAGGYIPADA